MPWTQETRDAPDRRLLCAIAFTCYSAALAALAALGYSLSMLTISAVGQQIATAYTTLGNAAR